MPCERFANGLTDLAASSPAGPELEAHLASCERCRSELAVLREALGAADEELARVAAAIPSPQLRVLIRAAVADEPERAGAAIRWLWASVAAAAVVVLAALWTARAPQAPAARETTAFPGGSRGQGGGAVPEREAWPSRTESRPGATEPTRTRDAERGSRLADVPRPADAPRARAAAGDPVEAAAAAPDAARALAPPDGSPGRMRARFGSAEVLVPSGEREALLRLVALVHRERLTPGALGTVEGPRADLPQPAAIEIAPLAIVPLDPEESGQGEGDTP